MASSERSRRLYIPILKHFYLYYLRIAIYSQIVEDLTPEGTSTNAEVGPEVLCWREFCSGETL